MSAEADELGHEDAKTEEDVDEVVEMAAKPHVEEAEAKEDAKEEAQKVEAAISDGASVAAPPPAADAVCGEAVWEVLLCGQFKPFEPHEQRNLEEAFARGALTAPVRGGTREVTLCPPHVQRQAPGRSSPCKERRVQRRVRGASPPAAGRPSLAAACPVAREAPVRPRITAADSLGTRRDLPALSGPRELQIRGRG